MLVGRTRFLPMESRSFVYSLAPDARVVRAGEAYLILNPAFGTWAKIGRYAGLMFERSLGINIPSNSGHCRTCVRKRGSRESVGAHGGASDPGIAGLRAFWWRDGGT